MANKRITDVDFLDSLNSNESFFVNKNNAIKQIAKSNIVFDIVNGGTGATDASTALVNLGAAAKSHTHTASEIGAAPSTHSHNAADITSGALSVDRLPIVSISKGGTGATDGATALKNLFASGNTILSSYQYGDTLPAAGTVGRIFYKKV